MADELARWPGLRLSRGRCGTGPALSLGEREIVHLPTDHEAELRLGAPAVQRLGPILDDTGQLIALPVVDLAATGHRLDGSECGSRTARGAQAWVRIRLVGESDRHLVLALASVAIAAHTALPGEARQGDETCPRARRIGISRTSSR
ncbi:luciferase family protein [Actinomadura rubrisoli]|uniref:luciferase family protein n=1 Tax=Actinomadura rubrisoli TaxID=2530368 RepID=UPI0010509B30|nr:luciferase family protein [Actinomadura rubrisoli]